MQSATLKIEDLEKARTFENKHFMILSAKMKPETGHQVILKSDTNKKPIIFFNQNRSPFCIKVSHEFAEGWRIRQEIKQSQMNTKSPENLYQLIKQVEKSVANLWGQEKISEWEEWKRIFAYEDVYGVAFNRGVRHERKRIKAKNNNLTAFDLISADDVIELSNKLGISEDKLTYAVLEILAKRKNGGVV